MSLVPARWERVKRAVEIRNMHQGEALMQTLIVGYNPAELDPVEDDEDDTDELHRHGIYEEN